MRTPLISLLLVTGCYTGMHEAPAYEPPSESDASDQASGGDDGSDAPNEPNEPGAGCGLTATPIARLTSVEYVNTVHGLFPGVALPPLEPIPDERVDGMLGHTSGQSVSALGVQRYEAMASNVARVVAAELGAWAPCTHDDAACVEQIVLALAPRVYRRPLTGDEVAELQALAAETHADHGLVGAVEVVVQALLQSPSFLFLPELGIDEHDGRVALEAYELASRLSYFFLDDMPDSELLDAAATGELTTPEGLEHQARRLLYDERARPVLTGFLGEWLRLYELDELALDPVRFPELDGELRHALEQSARRYLEEVLWEEDSWRALMTGSFGYVDARLAPIFGVSLPTNEEALAGGDGLVRVELDPMQRRGILTQPAILSSTSHGIGHSPIFRGVTLLDHVLCLPMPAPPPNIFEDEDDGVLQHGLVAPDDVPEELCTTRDVVSQTHTVDPECQGCHQIIDGVGFAFEHYDALGRYRTTENGCAIDASGRLPGGIGPVDDAIELAEALAAGEAARECLGTHLLRFGTGRSETSEDRCTIEAVAQVLHEGDGSLQELIIHFVLSPTFLTRPAN